MSRLRFGAVRRTRRPSGAVGVAGLALVISCSSSETFIGTTSTSTASTGTTSTSSDTSSASTTTSSDGGAAGAGGAGGAAGGGAGAGGAMVVDMDGDGIDDELEQTIAESYFPHYSPAPDDACPRRGVVFRLTAHPQDAALLTAWYVVLFEKDCGLNGHVGDDEVFGAVIDPSKPAPQGLLALRAISHQDTLCERTTTCGTLPGCKSCDQSNGVAVVYASKNKHGGYVDEGSCDLNVICDFGGCTLDSKAMTTHFVNAGEPAMPLVNDLTAQGFITAANGWTEQELMGFDPWSGNKFGSAGDVADDLVDAAFVIDPTGCK